MCSLWFSSFTPSFLLPQLLLKMFGRLNQRAWVYQTASNSATTNASTTAHSPLWSRSDTESSFTSYPSPNTAAATRCIYSTATCSYRPPSSHRPRTISARSRCPTLILHRGRNLIRGHLLPRRTISRYSWWINVENSSSRWILASTTSIFRKKTIWFKVSGARQIRVWCLVLWTSTLSLYESKQMVFIPLRAL